uniref:phosphoethanolamine transferase n=1 Tax=Pararhizobium sp. IMCC3301 TaxID=3067904 RepID=UPI002740C38B|nr:phosphoethanolamine--lipid A transferase [Pararhizobium sp. IMCC3301]
MRVPKLTRPALSPVLLSALVTLYLFAGLNNTFWSRGVAVFDGHSGKLVLLAVTLLLAHIAGLLVFSNKYVFKPVLIFFILVAAISAYFVDGFGVVIDHEMIRNTVTTTVNEASDLMTPAFWLHLLVFAVLPIAFVAFVTVKRGPVLKQVLFNAAFVAITLVVGGTIMLSNFSAYSSIFRERQDFMAVINPAAPVAGAVKYVRRAMRETNIVAQPLGTDARQGTVLKAATKPLFVVLVIGETARAQNFGLNGYERNTTPQLAKRDVINFSDTSSCGTATAVSLPCMFSHYARDSFSNEKGKASENLLDIVQRAGFQVAWWENNTGNKGIAKRVPNQKLSNGTNPEFCRDGECDDGIFTETLKPFIGEAKDNTLLVMHQIGSHGPAYYKRYPQAMEVFAPACRTAQFADCTQEEIVAAYDNTILYTDKNVADIIDLAKSKSDTLATAVIFMSDHGESLGESGLYLHGAPYFIAPEEQTKVPFVAWFSEEFKNQMNLNTDCVSARKDSPVSQDNLFHSMLGLLNIETEVRQPALDLFGTCMAQNPASLAMTTDR